MRGGWRLELLHLPSERPVRAKIASDPATQPSQVPQQARTHLRMRASRTRAPRRTTTRAAATTGAARAPTRGTGTEFILWLRLTVSKVGVIFGPKVTYIK